MMRMMLYKGNNGLPFPHYPYYIVWLQWNLPVRGNYMDDNHMEKASFAGGCFWCIHAAFDLLEGVGEVVSGYSGGHVENPSYEEVCAGDTGHVEAVQVEYNPDKVSYNKLLGVFWESIDPTDDSGQYADKGSQYRSAIFYHDEGQRKLAEESRKRLEESKGIVVATQIKKYKNFYPAEDYHQDYYKKNKLRYKLYKRASGRY